MLQEQEDYMELVTMREDRLRQGHERTEHRLNQQLTETSAAIHQLAVQQGQALLKVQALEAETKEHMQQNASLDAAIQGLMERLNQVEISSRHAFRGTQQEVGSQVEEIQATIDQLATVFAAEEPRASTPESETPDRSRGRPMCPSFQQTMTGRTSPDVAKQRINRNQVTLPKFSGAESLQGFLNQLENAVRLGNWTPDYLAGQLYAQLSGGALQFIDTKPAAQRETYTALVNTLRERYEGDLE